MPEAGPPALPTGASEGWRHLVAWFFGRRRRVRVAGHSMVPTLQDGDHVLVDPGALRPTPGAVVWIRHPHRPDLTMVKRVHRVAPDGSLTVVGDNPGRSTDSRQFGALPPDLVLGTVVWRFAR